MSSVPLRARLVGLLLLISPLAASGAEGGLQLLPELPEPLASVLGAPAGWGLVLLMLLFVLLIAPVNKLVFEPLFRVLDERDERTAGTRARAQQLERETDEVLTRYEEQVAEARAEAERERRGLLEAARSDATGTTGGARAEAEQQIEAARQEIGAALASARNGLRAEAQELARQAAARVLGRPL